MKPAKCLEFSMTIPDVSDQPMIRFKLFQEPQQEVKLQRDLKPQLELKTLISDKTFSSKFR